MKKVKIPVFSDIFISVNLFGTIDKISLVKKYYKISQNSKCHKLAKNEAAKRGR